MGCSFSTVHAFVGSDDGLGQQRVADAIRGTALVSLPLNGWISVYPDCGRWYDGAELSLRLSVPVVTFRAEDSDIAAAKLYVGGAPITTLVSTIAGPRNRRGELVGIRQFIRDMTRDPDASSYPYYDFYIDALTWPKPLTDLLLTEQEVCIDADAWISTLGRSTMSAIRGAVDDCIEWPFPEHIIGMVLNTFGLDREQSRGTLRWKGKSPETAGHLINAAGLEPCHQAG
jgi:hypothetical protein